MDDKIEILPVSLLESERSTVVDLKNLADQLNLEFGWHYLLDLTWIIQQLGDVAGRRIVDAGAGTGMIQWYLASLGADVVSVDRESRVDLAGRFRRRFTIIGLRQEDLSPGNGLSSTLSWKNQSIKKFGSEFIDILRTSGNKRGIYQDEITAGQVIIYNQDLGNLEDIEDNSVDAVVAVSSLEHNSPEDLRSVVKELIRILKPGSAMYATLGAARDSDWFHEPSHGWCYSEDTLRDIFSISPETRSNYDKYDQLFESLQENDELRENIASFYYRSGDNGMPWGEWNPQYQPVGIRKYKRE